MGRKGTFTKGAMEAKDSNLSKQALATAEENEYPILTLDMLMKWKSKHHGGVVCIGNLPKGFEEPQLRQFFEQFGAVVRVCVPRSQKTHLPKSYGYVHFVFYEVAQIAAAAVNNYMLFSHVLRTTVLRKGMTIIPRNLGRVLKKMPLEPVPLKDDSEKEKVAATTVNDEDDEDDDEDFTPLEPSAWDMLEPSVCENVENRAIRYAIRQGLLMAKELEQQKPQQQQATKQTAGKVKSKQSTSIDNTKPKPGSKAPAKTKAAAVAPARKKPTLTNVAVAPTRKAKRASNGRDHAENVKSAKTRKSAARC